MTLIQRASEESETFRILIETVDASDGIVYVEEGHCRSGAHVEMANQPFILRSDLGATILRMISTHSLAAFTPAVDRAAPARPPREAGSTEAAPAVVEAAASPAQRTLEAVPAQPARPAPRGSLLDLRV